jgi:hypothetical protein
MTLDLNNLDDHQLVRLNLLSEIIKDDYQNLIEEVYLRSNKDISWLFSSLLSRNPYESNLFINLLNLVFIKEELDKNEFDKLIIDDYTLYDLIKPHFDKNKIVVKNKNYTIKRFLLKTFSIFKLFVISLIFIIDKISNKRKKIIKNEIRLIDVFWHKSMFSNDNYIDRYYGKLRDYFDEKELKKIYYIPTIVDFQSLSFFRESSIKRNLNVIFKHDYIKIKDYFTSINSLIKSKFYKVEYYYFKGFEVSNLLSLDFHENKYNTSSFHGLLNYFFCKRLTEHYPNNFKTVLNWFENQAIDKGLNKGFNDFFPDTNLKGFQGSILSLDYNSHLCPTKLENKIGVLPKEIFICGKALQNDVKQFDDSLKVNTTSAFRFDYLWHHKSKKNSKEIVLVILPSIHNDCVEIIENIIFLANNKDLRNINFKLKLHPDLNENNFNSLKKEFPNTLKFYKKELYFSFKITQLLIGNSSSALTEGLACGIPVIVIGSRRGLTQNPIPKSINKKFWKLVFGEAQLLNATKEFIKREGPALIDENQQKSIKSNFFEPMNKTKIRRLLDF